MNIEDLNTVVFRTADILWKIGNELDFCVTRETKLIFPADQQPQKKKKLRISEQEAKLIFIKQLESFACAYSVETPTIKKYKFSGDAKGQRSGSLDLCIFKIQKNKYIREVNVEFKAHNMKPYLQDFEKLIREPGLGVFFHLLESVNNGTLTSTNNRKGVLVKYKAAFAELANIIRNIEKEITIYLVSLNPRFIIVSRIDTAHDINLDIEYLVKNGEITFNKLHNWVQLDHKNCVSA